MKPFDWDKLSKAVRRSDNLRLPRNPEKTLRDMNAKLAQLKRGSVA